MNQTAYTDTSRALCCKKAQGLPRIFPQFLQWTGRIPRFVDICIPNRQASSPVPTRKPVFLLKLQPFPAKSAHPFLSVPKSVHEYPPARPRSPTAAPDYCRSDSEFHLCSSPARRPPYL